MPPGGEGLPRGSVLNASGRLRLEFFSLCIYPWIVERGELEFSKLRHHLFRKGAKRLHKPPVLQRPKSKFIEKCIGALLVNRLKESLK